MLAATRRSLEALHLLLVQAAPGAVAPAALAGLAVYFYCAYYATGQPADGRWAQYLARQLAASMDWPTENQAWSAAQLEQASALAWLEAQSKAVALPSPALPAQLAGFDKLIYKYAQSLLAQAEPGSRQHLVRSARYLSLRPPASTAGHYHAALLAAWPGLPAGRIDLSLASGLAGELLCLMQAGQVAEVPIYQGLRCLLASRRDTDFLARHYAIFPNQLWGESPTGTFDEELSWSRGDAGQALLLYEAHVQLHDPELRTIAELVGLNTTLRNNSATTSITHAGFYRGAAGLAQLYKRLFQISGHPAYRVAYEHWLKCTQQLLWPDWPPLNHLASIPIEEGLFNGIIGVGLVFLSACHNNALSWEAILVISQGSHLS
jgi:hypothetical protein